MIGSSTRAHPRGDHERQIPLSPRPTFSWYCHTTHKTFAWDIRTVFDAKIWNVVWHIIYTHCIDDDDPKHGFHVLTIAFTSTLFFNFLGLDFFFCRDEGHECPALCQTKHTLPCNCLRWGTSQPKSWRSWHNRSIWSSGFFKMCVLELSQHCNRTCFVASVTACVTCNHSYAVCIFSLSGIY